MLSPEEVLPALRPLLAARAQEDDAETFPRERLSRLRELRLLDRFASIGSGEETALLLDVLRIVGAADLSLGRIFEGHVNATQLVHAYGDDAQRAALHADLAAGRVFGVWAAGEPGVALERTGDGWRLSGRKTFASGAGEIDRALVPASFGDGPRRLVLVDVADRPERADVSGWRVRGMKGTVSGVFDFTGMVVADSALIGVPGDYEREPRFSGGAWRFCAVQLGAAEALVRELRDAIRRGRGDDPIGRARFAAALTAVRSAGLWVAQAADATERGCEDAVALTLMTRGVVEEAALGAMEAAARTIGTASFHHGRVDRITRDLGLYLRQPAPDAARDRAAALWIERDRWDGERWW